MNIILLISGLARKHNIIRKRLKSDHTPKENEKKLMPVTGDCRGVIPILIISSNLLCRKCISESASGKYRAILRATKDNKGEEKQYIEVIIIQVGNA